MPTNSTHQPAKTEKPLPAGENLDARVALALGWTNADGGWLTPEGKPGSLPAYSTDEMAMESLKARLSTMDEKYMVLYRFKGKSIMAEAIALNNPWTGYNPIGGPPSRQGYAHATALLALKLLEKELPK